MGVRLSAISQLGWRVHTASPSTFDRWAATDGTEVTVKFNKSLGGHRRPGRHGRAHRSRRPGGGDHGLLPVIPASLPHRQHMLTTACRQHMLTTWQ